MNYWLKITIGVVAILLMISLGVMMIHSDDGEIVYEYELFYEYSYVDNDGVTHRPQSGNVFIWAEIHEVNVGDSKVLALPNCYSLRSEDGTVYEWTTGWTEQEELYENESADIITIFEVPKSFQRGHIIWMMESVEATCVN